MGPFVPKGVDLYADVFVFYDLNLTVRLVLPAGPINLVTRVVN